MYASVTTASLYGLESKEVRVEIDVARGLPSFTVVGLANRSIREAKERIHSAVDGCGYRFPQKRITVNLSPANRKKEGSHFDLPIAAGVLIASAQVVPQPGLLKDTALLGELSLDGRLEPVDGVLPLVIGMRQRGIRQVILPRGNCAEAEAVADMVLIPAETLLQVGEHISGFRPLQAVRAAGCSGVGPPVDLPDFCDINGQDMAKRAAAIAAAGAHGMLMVGPPGVGKSMIGERIPGIMPELSESERLEITQIYSIAGLLNASSPIALRRPFRSPHHSLTVQAMTGGGSRPRPGEVSLAHRGVLFLDELPEFSRQVLDTLRQPLEQGRITISRVQYTTDYPARFMLIAAMNPCRCGYFGDAVKPCTCTETDRQRYVGKISGPLLDRIDLHIGLERMDYGDIDVHAKRAPGLSSQEIRSHVEAAAQRQTHRYRNMPFRFNAQLPPESLAEFCRLDQASNALVRQAFSAWTLSARSYHRLLRVARTLADYEESERIREEHVLEALSYRMPERAQEMN